MDVRQPRLVRSTSRPAAAVRGSRPLRSARRRAAFERHSVIRRPGGSGRHDWPFWHHQMWTYCSRLCTERDGESRVRDLDRARDHAAERGVGRDDVPQLSPGARPGRDPAHRQRRQPHDRLRRDRGRPAGRPRPGADAEGSVAAGRDPVAVRAGGRPQPRHRHRAGRRLERRRARREPTRSWAST